jgi:vitamin K-dependent gamma-carboxylase
MRPDCEFGTGRSKSVEMPQSSPEVCADQPVDAEPQARRGVTGLVARLFVPIDIAPLVFFRISFGLLMLVEVGAYAFSGYLRTHWMDPQFHFTYYGFGWVSPPPGNWMYALTTLLMLSAAGLMLGFYYRLSAVVFTLGFTWVFLIEQANYLNHFYLICLLSFIAIALPANRARSLDCVRKPSLRVEKVPAWTVWILQAHMAIAYFYGGIAKLNWDWLDAAPVRVWFTTGGPAAKVPDFLKREFVFYLVSYSGLLLDLLIVPLLLWRRTRGLAIALAVTFHLCNFWLFDIGVFPFLSIALTLLFVDSRWHRRILRLGPAQENGASAAAGHRWIAVPLMIYVALQLIIPFRHWLYPGSPHWTEEGHRFSWHMMLRSKRGDVYFVVRDTAGKLWRIDPREVLSRRQYQKMAGHPDMLLQFAHFLRDKAGPSELSIYAVSYVSLNGRPRALLIDPEVNLARKERSLRHAAWILPLENQESPPARYRFATPASVRHFARREN